MKILLLFLILFCNAARLCADTPAEVLIDKYQRVEGFKRVKAQGSTMAFARPVIKRYPIGPMADSVERVSVMRFNKAEADKNEAFMADFNKVMKQYQYYGKSETPDGLVDVYVHLESPDTVDELVIYNEHKETVNSLVGVFPVKSLLSLAL